MTTRSNKFGTILIDRQYQSFITQEDVITLCTLDGNHPSHDINLYDIGMSRGNGYGQYEKYVILDVNGKQHRFSQHSTDSQLYDQLKDEDERNEVLYNIFQSVMRNSEDELLNIELDLDEDAEDEE